MCTLSKLHAEERSMAHTVTFSEGDGDSQLEPQRTRRGLLITAILPQEKSRYCYVPRTHRIGVARPRPDASAPLHRGERRLNFIPNSYGCRPRGGSLKSLAATKITQIERHQIVQGRSRQEQQPQ